MARPSAIDRFTALYIVATPPESRRPDLGPCWLWKSQLNEYGYAYFYFNGRPRRAHIWAYVHYKGEYDRSLDLDHLCHIRRCVNPGHMEPVTTRENLMRSNTIQARNARKTHCLRGHLFDAANTYLNNGRYRRCRKCDALRYHLRRMARAGVAIQLELSA